MEKKDYITQGETIIFSPNYYELLNPELLLDYKKIIFSDYVLKDCLFEAYENNNLDKKKFIGSYFNQPLSNSLDNLTQLSNNQKN